MRTENSHVWIRWDVACIRGEEDERVVHLLDKSLSTLSLSASNPYIPEKLCVAENGHSRFIVE